MNSAIRNSISLLIVGAAGAGFWWLGEPEVFKRPPGKPKPPAVKTEAAIEHEDGIQFVVDGVVVPFRQIAIATQVGGRVAFKSENCRVGRAVESGELLLKIDPTDYELDVRRITEEVKQARASLEELETEIQNTENQVATAEQQLNLEQRQVKRSTDLVQKRITSAAEVDDAKRGELTSRNALQMLRDQKALQKSRRSRLESAIALGEANLEQAELALSRTEIHAPIDGVVTVENVEEDGFLQMGSPVVTLQDSSQLDVTCKLHMKQMHWLWQSRGAEPIANVSQAYDFPRTPATIMYELAGTSFEWKGVVNRYDGAGVDNQTRMVPCRVNVADPLQVASKHAGEKAYASPPTLMTGMFVKVKVDAKPPIPLVRVPQKAVQPGNNVWINQEGKLQRKKISIATSLGDYVVAYQEVGGLQAGDEIVITPLATPVEGQEVVDADNLPEGYLDTSGGFNGRGGGPPGRGKGPPTGNDGSPSGRGSPKSGQGGSR